ASARTRSATGTSLSANAAWANASAVSRRPGPSSVPARSPCESERPRPARRDTGRTMSQENVEVVRDVYERWSQGDFRTSVDVFDPLVLLVLRPEFPDAGTYLGRERV